MRHFNYNGKIYKTGSHIIGPDNRGLKYGDGLFETLRYSDGNIILIDEHFSRLWNGLTLLEFDIPKLFTPESLQKETQELLIKNNESSARIRINILRGDGGIYDSSNGFNYIIQSSPVNQTKWNDNGLQLIIYDKAFKMADAFANCKHNNYLPYSMGAMAAKKEKANDAVILNNSGRVCETTIANIFIVKNAKIYTPALTEGCVAGIMRKFIINTLKKKDIFITEEPVFKDMLMEADEVFLTNSIFNIQWVFQIGDKKYTSSFIRNIYNTLSETNPQVFC